MALAKLVLAALALQLAVVLAAATAVLAPHTTAQAEAVVAVREVTPVTAAMAVLKLPPHLRVLAVVVVVALAKTEVLVPWAQEAVLGFWGKVLMVQEAQPLVKIWGEKAALGEATALIGVAQIPTQEVMLAAVLVVMARVTTAVFALFGPD
jgi:hypothetical protein